MNKFASPADIVTGTSINRPLFIFVIIVSLIPLLVTPVLPLTDFYAHIARYYILANLEESLSLQQHYEAAWRLLPNLGLDILGVGILKLTPPLVAAKLIAALVIAAPFMGILYLSYVLHGRVASLTIILAGLAAYNHILIWGFSNFLLGLGVLLGGLGYWISAQDRPRRQLGITICLGVTLFFIHGLAFALWGFLLGAVELSLAMRAGDLRLNSLARRAGRLTLIAVGPVLLFLQTNTIKSEGGATGSLVNLMAHADKGTLWARLGEELQQRIDGTLRVVESTWRTADWGIGALLWCLLAIGLLTGVWRLDRRFWLPVILCVALVGLTPPNLFGVGHLSERIPLLLLTLFAAGLSVSPGTRTSLQRLVFATLVMLFLARNLLLTIGWYQGGKIYTSYLDALEHYDTGQLGAAAYLEDAKDPQFFRPNCRPLSFLLLYNGTAVPTFANPTQQPMNIIGPLAKVTRAMQQVSAEPDQTIQTALTVFSDAKTDTIVTCSGELSTTAPSGFKIIAATPPWILYQRETVE